MSVDSPNYGFHWGNETAAPAVRGVYSRIINDKVSPLAYDDLMKPAQAKTTEFLTKKIDNPPSTFPTLSTKHQSESNKKIEKVPDFRGKTLKQALKLAKDIGLSIDPVGFVGRVVWQSVKPGTNLKSCKSCKLKLELNS